MKKNTVLKIMIALNGFLTIAMLILVGIWINTTLIYPERSYFLGSTECIVGFSLIAGGYVLMMILSIIAKRSDE